MASLREDRIRSYFPKLKSEPFVITSEPDPAYNCIAWAAGDNQKPWWPLYPAYWPSGAPVSLRVSAFCAVFAGLGYIDCGTDWEFEEGWEKVAIYALEGRVKHMARQLPSGEWTSKLGVHDDISHTLDGLIGSEYGQPIRCLKRQRFR